MWVNAKFLFLGCGSSMGVPVIGCDCEVCQSKVPHNQRLRPSGLISIEGKNILLDCGPDFRVQALNYGIKKLDGVIITHPHNDHIAGVDDLRIYYYFNRRPLPCLMSEETADGLKKRFDYIFLNKNNKIQLTTQMEIKILEGDEGVTHFLGLVIPYTTYYQAKMKVNGFRFGELAYLTDIQEYHDSIFDFLKGVKYLIISALRFTPSHIHLTVDDAVDFAEKVGASITYLTHLAHELDYEKTNAYLPSNIRMAYDGLEFEFEAQHE